MAFNNATRRQIIALPAQVHTSGTTLTWDLPRVGLLSRIWLTVRGTTNLAPGPVHAMGYSAVSRRIRVISNAGIDIFNTSGPGYDYLVRPYLDFPGDPVPYSDGRTAIAAATAFQVDKVLPIAVNLRDPVGLIMLQSEQTLITLQVECETDTNILGAGGTWTVAPTYIPYIEVFSIPRRAEDWPGLSVVHQVLEDQTVVSGAGSITYNWPRGNTYLQMIHGFGFDATPLDNWSRVQVRVNQSNYLYDVPPEFLDLEQTMLRYQQRIAGTIPIDLISSTGLGTYDLMRDTIDSRYVTDLQTVLTATAAGTLYSVRRQLVPLSK